VDERPLTLPQLAAMVDVEYRTLHTWVKRGLIRPSLQSSKGTGTPNLFTPRDAVIARVMADLRKAGVSFDLMNQAARRLEEEPAAVEGTAVMLVNGDVSVYTDTAKAAARLERGGLTLAYNTADAVEHVEQALQ
jgi:DNA-binding transcriptional MerR regulator